MGSFQFHLRNKQKGDRMDKERFQKQLDFILEADKIVINFESFK